MSTATPDTSASPARGHTKPDAALLKRRYAAEGRYQLMGLSAILIGLGFLVLLFTSIISNGWTAFLQSKMNLEVFLDPAELSPDGKTDPDTIRRGDFTKLARQALLSKLGIDNPNRSTRRRYPGR